MKAVISYLWQLPQHLLALLLIRYLRARRWYKTQSIFVYMPTSRLSTKLSGLSLGKYILFRDADGIGTQAIAHEHGHSKQSLIFGPLYLLVIGIPSLCNNLWARCFHKEREWYYSRYPERWADKLGGVERE